MTDIEKTEIINAVIDALNDNSTNYDNKVVEPYADDVVLIMRKEGDARVGKCVTWEGISETLAAAAKSYAEASGQSASTAEEAKTNVENMKAPVEQTVSDFNTVAHEKKQEVQGVYQSDLNELKGDLTSITNCKRITNWKSGYIATNESVVDINTILPHENFRCCVLDCEKGDKFTVTLSGASVARMYCFIDANNAVIEVSPHTPDLSNHVIIAPENSSKLVLNDKSNSDSYIGVFIEHEISEIKNNVDLFTNPFSEVLYDGNPVVYHDTFAYPVNNVVTGRSNEKYDMFKFSMKRGVIAVNAIMQGSASALCYITDSENNIIKTIERGRETE